MAAMLASACSSERPVLNSAGAQVDTGASCDGDRSAPREADAEGGGEPRGHRRPAAPSTCPAASAERVRYVPRVRSCTSGDVGIVRERRATRRDDPVGAASRKIGPTRGSESRMTVAQSCRRRAGRRRVIAGSTGEQYERTRNRRATNAARSVADGRNATENSGLERSARDSTNVAEVDRDPTSATGTSTDPRARSGTIRGRLTAST